MNHKFKLIQVFKIGKYKKNNQLKLVKKKFFSKRKIKNFNKRNRFKLIVTLDLVANPFMFKMKKFKILIANIMYFCNTNLYKYQ